MTESFDVPRNEPQYLDICGDFVRARGIVELPFVLVGDRVGPTEDLERAADGVPHGVVGLTVVFAVVFSIFLGVLFLTGGTILAFVLGIIGLPILVTNLVARADRSRDHVHPSR